MATLAYTDARNLLRVISDVPVSFNHKDTGTWTLFTNAGTYGAVIETKPLQDGGFLQESDLTLTTSLKKLDSDGSTLVDRFTTPPKEHDKIIVAGVQYRITQTTQDELGNALVMDLKRAERPNAMTYEDDEVQVFEDGGVMEYEDES